MSNWMNKWASIYLMTVVGCNVGFAALPLIDTPFGMLAPMTFFVGFVFVFRDFAQKDIGHRVLLYMAIALALSWFMANPFVAVGSAAAFFFSELVDWLIYTFSKLSFRARIVLSSLISTPIDSVVFLTVIGHLTIPSLIMMSVVKLLAIAVVFWLPKTTCPAHDS